SGGWTPSVHLFSQSRGRLRFDGESGTFLPGEPAVRARSAGACAGVFGLAACLDAGWIAGGGADRRFAVGGHDGPMSGAAGYAAAAGEAQADAVNEIAANEITGEGAASGAVP